MSGRDYVKPCGRRASIPALPDCFPATSRARPARARIGNGERAAAQRAASCAYLRRAGILRLLP